MVSLSMVKNLGIPVHLPVASSGVPREERNLHTLTVTEDDDLYFNKEKISFDELRERLGSLKVADPDPKVIINGDERALFGSAIMVLDEVRKTGITKVSIQTKGKADS
jgi:biopolymer transport protein ExbD